MHVTDLPIAIIGAGPYGLSIAAHLRGRGIPFRIFGEPMQSWREQMPASMLLKSEGFASNICDPDDEFTLERFCAEAGIAYADVAEPVRLETFVAYGLEFQRRFAPELQRTHVTAVTRAPGGFALTTATGETLRSSRVIVAAGISHFSYIPPVLRAHPLGLVTHSSMHRDASCFKGRTVAVIGAGASAIDLAALMHEAGVDVRLIARRSSIGFHEPSLERRSLLSRVRAPRSGLGLGWRSRFCTDAPLLFHAMPAKLRVRVVQRHLGPAPGWFMKDRVVGKIPIQLGAAIKGLSLANGRKPELLLNRSGRAALEAMPVDHVVAATGYKAVIERLPFLAEGLRAAIRTVDGAPALSRCFESSVPGLYFVGLASANSFGPLARFAFGARFTARRLTRHLAAAIREVG